MSTVDISKPGAKKDSRFARLRAEITSPELTFLMEAHNGLSAKIVEEAGFKGIWASGLSISTALGLRDNNEASWTQVLETLEFMADASSLPILVDGDTGYGNFNNVRRLVKKLCERGIAGVCIEDKLFPKTNSLGDGLQLLADVDEFCGRIKAGKDSQPDDDFMLVARVEALIVGLPLPEALRRAEAYRKAGADAILIHSRQRNPAEILAFAEAWANRAPLVIVPTTYYATPTSAFREARISTVIWANHNMRACLAAMRETCRQIRETESIVDVESRVPRVDEIFRLMGNPELEEAERRYLPSRQATRAIVLAAASGQAFGALTDDKPKCMLDVRGEPLLQRLVTTLRECGIPKISVVRGYRKEAIVLPGIEVIDNDAFATTGEAASLACAIKRLEGACVVAYGDILFRRYILEGLMAAQGDIVIAVDAFPRDKTGAKRPRDFVQATRPFTPDVLDDESASLVRIAGDIAVPDRAGEWVGMVRFSAKGSELARAEIERLREEGLLATADVPLLLSRLAKHHDVRIHYVMGHWLDVNDLADLAEARNFS